MTTLHDKKADYYDSIYTESKKYLISAKDSPYKAVWDAVLEKLPSECSILDVGCGPGQFATLCIEANHSYVGADFSEVAIQRGRQIAPKATFHLVDLIKDKSLLTRGDYDVATLIEVLEHIGEDLKVLSAVPVGKKIILTVPKYWCEGHVRVFRTPNEVSTRYGALIDIDSLSTIVHGKASERLWGPHGPRTHGQWTIYILSGTRQKVK